MDINRAKQEIKDAIEAYLTKDEYGQYSIPVIRQRPILLMGPPGIGKTQIMEQIAKQCGVGLVSYTITHHTRQSAVGLPFIKEKHYGEKIVSVTEYTMSEIIASVYEKIEQTGIQEGILFIDEINCVSETLAPTMLQFLQGKTFGNQRVPQGWVIVTAGNPPEYNKSVRDFDVVTLDRIRKLDVEANLEVWKDYAYRQGIHPAVISYLELRKENFYRIETTVDGKYFVTARGWQDLSQLIQVYETLGKAVDRQVVYQYVQHPNIAKDFANYLELYYKYKEDYGVEEILEGNWNTATLQKIKVSSFDEHLSIVSLLNGKLSSLFTACHTMDAYVCKLYEYLVYYKENQADISLESVVLKAEEDFAQYQKTELITKREERTMHKVIAALQRFVLITKGRHILSTELFADVRMLFEQEVSKREEQMKKAAAVLEHAFLFLEDAFGESPEMVAFVTELNANYYSIWFIKEHGSDLYYRYNKGLLFDKKHQQILMEMDRLQAL